MQPTPDRVHCKPSVAQHPTAGPARLQLRRHLLHVALHLVGLALQAVALALQLRHLRDVPVGSRAAALVGQPVDAWDR